jgi:hypothetical protein
MNRNILIIILALLVVSVGIAWILTGGPQGDRSAAVPEVTPASPAAPDITRAITVTTSSALITTATLAGTPPPLPATSITVLPTTPVSPDDIKVHFLDVAYGGGNRLERLNYTADSQRVVISVSAAQDSDVSLIESTALAFNAVSQTNKISENIKQGTNGDITLKFIPESGMNAIQLADVAVSGKYNESLTRREFMSHGVSAAKIVRGTAYINSNLKGEARNHTIARSILYEMGLTGETAKYADSIFYAGDNENVELSYLDRKVVEMMYEPGLVNGMTIDDLRKVIYIR